VKWNPLAHQWACEEVNFLLKLFPVCAWPHCWRGALDVPARLTAAERRLDASLAGDRKLEPLAAKFYATLNDRQKDLVGGGIDQEMVSGRHDGDSTGVLRGTRTAKGGAGVVTLSNRERDRPAALAVSSGRDGLARRVHRRGAEASVGLGGCEVALDVEDVVNGCVS
jgi:hypothetical protein